MKYPKLYGWEFEDYHIRRSSRPSVGRQNLKRRTRRASRRYLSQEVATQLANLE